MDVVEVFVEVDSVSCVLDGGGECKHEVRDCSCQGVQHPKTAGVEAELCNEESVMGEGGDSDGVGDEPGNDVVGSQCKGPVGPMRTSQPRRWGILWMRHCKKRRSLVCWSVMAVDMVVMHVWMSISWVLKYSLAKAGEPTGEPRRRKPVVSSAGSGGPRILISFGLVPPTF